MGGDNPNLDAARCSDFDFLGRRIRIKTIDARNLERAVHLDYHRILGDLKGGPYDTKGSIN